MEQEEHKETEARPKHPQNKTAETDRTLAKL